MANYKIFLKLGVPRAFFLGEPFRRCALNPALARVNATTPATYGPPPRLPPRPISPYSASPPLPRGLGETPRPWLGLERSAPRVCMCPLPGGFAETAKSYIDL